MPINYRKIRTLTARQLIRGLERDGFELRRQSGSHQQYIHPKDKR